MRSLLRQTGSSSIPIKSEAHLEKMRDAGKALHEVFQRVGETAKPGATTGDLDRVAREAILALGAHPAFLQYPHPTLGARRPFPASICASVNEELVHGIPSTKRVLNEGDIISVDIGLRLRGWYADRAVTFAIGEIDDLSRRLMDVAWLSFWIPIMKLRPGAKIGEYQALSQRIVEDAGFHVVTEYCSHGVGRSLHEDPQIKNYGGKNDGFRLKAGMVFAIEPMIGAGTAQTKALSDDWTVVIEDRSRAAHYEHTVAVTADGPEIMTLPKEEAEKNFAQAARRAPEFV
jgi:methionyl aminopeptidase